MRFWVRRAKIDEAKRDLFEQCGADVVALALGLGSLVPGSNQFPTHVLQTVVLGQADAMAWLQEKRDEEQCVKRRGELVEWAILIFVGLEVVHDFSPAIEAALRH